MVKAHHDTDMSIDVTESGTPLTERVAEEIRGWMGRRRLSQAALARQLGVSKMWVSYRLSGTQPIDLNDLDRIARALGVAVADLLPPDVRRASDNRASYDPTPGRPRDTRPKGRPGADRHHAIPTRPERHRPVRISRPHAA